jgi:hypothetical protein
MIEPNIQIASFQRGIIRDGVDDPERLISARDLINYDIDDETGDAVIRSGTQRYHDTGLATAPQQLYHYVDTDGNQNDLCVSAGNLYWVDPLAAHTEIKNWSSGSGGVSLSFTNGVKYPFVTLEDGRCVFADDGDVYWTDNSLASTGKCYQLGIDAPTDAFIDDSISIDDDPGFTQGTEDTDNQLSTNYKIAQSFTVPANSVQTIDGVILMFKRTGSPNGYLHAQIETDNSNEPSGTLFDSNGVSHWERCLDIPASGTDYSLKFPETIEVTGGGSGTKYWIVIEADSVYHAKPPDGSHHIDVRYDDTGSYAGGDMATYDGASWTVNSGDDLRFGVGLDLNTSNYYWYRFTYFDSNYVSESAPSKVYYAGSTAQAGFKITVPASFANPSATHINIYREELTSAQSGTTDFDSMEFNYVGRIPEGNTICYDLVETESTNLLDKTFTRPLETDGTALIPRYMAPYKSRLVMAKNLDNVLYYSLRVDKDGVLGYTGEPLYDMFAVDCFEKIPSGDTVTGLAVIRDMLAVFLNDNIWVVWGTDEAFNPPADLSLREQVSGTGCIAPASIVSIDPPEGESRLYCLSRHGAVSFDGYDTTSLSENIEQRLRVQSIIDGYTVTQRQDAFASQNGYEYWLVLNDGSNDYILIFETVDNRWRAYSYNLNLNHVITKAVGSNTGEILIAPTTGTFIQKVTSDATTDRDATNAEVSIVGTVETQKLRALSTLSPRATRTPFAIRPVWHHLYVDTYHDGTAPTYAVTVTDRAGNATSPTLSIGTDQRSRRCGFRVASDECRAKVQQTSTVRDKIRNLTFTWTEM